jgi:hypothetical protein
VVRKISQTVGGMEKIKCNNLEIKEVESFKYLGSKIVTNRSVKEEVTGIIKNAEEL